MFVSLLDALTRDDLPHKLGIKVSTSIRPRLALGLNVLQYLWLMLEKILLGVILPRPEHVHFSIWSEP